MLRNFVHLSQVHFSDTLGISRNCRDNTLLHPLYTPQPFPLHLPADRVTDLPCVGRQDTRSINLPVEHELRRDATGNADTEGHRGVTRGVTVFFKGGG